MAGAADFQRSKTQCPQGHPYDEANTRYSRDGRICRQCKRDEEKRRLLTPEGKAKAAARQAHWRETHREQDKARHRDRRERARKWIQTQPQRVACVRCGEAHPACLDFHHTDPNEKEFQIGQGMLSERAKSSIVREIAKCDVLCANCHRKLHWEERHQEGS